jgi:hypothetical protein
MSAGCVLNNASGAILLPPALWPPAVVSGVLEGWHMLVVAQGRSRAPDERAHRAAHTVGSQFWCCPVWGPRVGPSLLSHPSARRTVVAERDRRTAVPGRSLSLFGAPQRASTPVPTTGGRRRPGRRGAQRSDRTRPGWSVGYSSFTIPLLTADVSKGFVLPRASCA